MPVASSTSRSGPSSRGTRIEIDRSLGGDRRQHGVHADAALEPDVDAGSRVVDVAIAEADQRDGEVAHILLAARHSGARLRTRPAVDEQAGGAVDEEVGHLGIVEIAGERREGGMPRDERPSAARDGRSPAGAPGAGSPAAAREPPGRRSATARGWTTKRSGMRRS